MKFYTKKRTAPIISIVSLMDILTILLIFFIVTTSFKKDQPHVPINLPDAKSATNTPAAKAEPMVLAITKDEEIFLDGRKLTLDQVATSLRTVQTNSPNRALALQADEKASFGFMLKILVAMKEAGIQNLPTYTKPGA